METVHIELEIETNASTHTILDFLVFYITSLPNTELAVSLIYIVSINLILRLLDSHIKRHARNLEQTDHSPITCCEFTLKSTLAAVLKSISAFAGYIIYVRLRANYTKNSDCIVLMLLPLLCSTYHLVLMMYKYTFFPSFLGFLISPGLSMLIFWSLTVAEIMFVSMEYVFSSLMYSTHFMGCLVLAEDAIGVVYLVYLLRLPDILRKTGARQLGNPCYCPI